MANVFVNEDSLSDIADAIRSKLNVQTTYKPGEMAAAIESISGGGSTINNQNKTVHPSSSQQSITADSGYTGLGTVTVKGVTVENLSAANIVSGVTVKIGDADDDDSIASVTGTASSGGITPTGTKQISITQNGTTTEDVTNYANAEIMVNVSGGSGGAQISTGTFTGNDTNTVDIQLSFEPDMIYIYRSDIKNMVAQSAQAIAQTAIAKDMFGFHNRTTASATSLSGGNVSSTTGAVVDGRTSLNYFTYDSTTSKLTYKCNQGNAAAFLSTLTYNYVAIKWT